MQFSNKRDLQKKVKEKARSFSKKFCEQKMHDKKPFGRTVAAIKTVKQLLATSSGVPLHVRSKCVKTCWRPPSCRRRNVFPRNVFCP